MPLSEMLAALHNSPPQGTDWSEAQARRIAAEEGLGLTQAHMEVIHYLRSHCLDVDHPLNARDILRGMTRQFAAQGGRSYLYRLFPRGPVHQGCRVAGVEPPANTTDPSFGTVH